MNLRAWRDSLVLVSAYVALALLLCWTNPTAPDLARVVFFVTAQDSSGRAYRFEVSRADSAPVIPGAPESAYVTLPCSSRITSWATSCQAADTAGNMSDPSNVIRFTLPASIR